MYHHLFINVIVLIIIFLVVTVNFVQNLYPYSENRGVVSDITITLSTVIAQRLSVTVSGGNDKYVIII